MTKIFIWHAHARRDSFCGALADAYAKGAEAKGAEVRRQDLEDMDFDTQFQGYGREQALPDDLVQWQDHIRWADHVVFVSPYWWGGLPGRAKAVLDTALLPGFGFKYHKGKKVAWDKLLEGKTGDGLITSDTPPWLDTMVYRKPGRRVMRNQVFKFCGIKPRQVRQLGSIKMSTPEKRAKWLAQAEAMGAGAAGV